MYGKFRAVMTIRLFMWNVFVSPSDLVSREHFLGKEDFILSRDV